MSYNIQCMGNLETVLVIIMNKPPPVAPFTNMV